MRKKTKNKYENVMTFFVLFQMRKKRKEKVEKSRRRSLKFFKFMLDTGRLGLSEVNRDLKM